MYEIFANLLIENNKKAIDVSKATGIPASTFSDWKHGKSTPKSDKLKKIADFFHVSLTFLMTGKEPEPDFSDESAHLVAKLARDPELSKALQKYFELSETKKKHVIELINLLSE